VRRCNEIIEVSRSYKAGIHKSCVYVDLEQVFLFSLFIYWGTVNSLSLRILLIFCGNLDSAESGQLGSLGLPVSKCHVMHHYDAS
jgi:hypothetical protein